jgi:hypothetical protein
MIKAFENPETHFETRSQNTVKKEGWFYWQRYYVEISSRNHTELQVTYINLSNIFLMFYKWTLTCNWRRSGRINFRNNLRECLTQRAK